MSLAISPLAEIGLERARAARLDADRLAREIAPARDFTVEPPAPPRPAAGADPTPEAFRKFEAMMLQSFIQSMLPEDSEAVYGKGLAGDMWRSLMAEKIADVMADSGGIGVADRILKTYYAGSDTKF